MNRYPELSEHTPQQLGKEWAIITPSKVNEWFKDFEDYIQNEVKDPTIL